MTTKGVNIYLDSSELQSLRKDILNTFCSLSNRPVSVVAKSLNSNLNNYREIYDSINNKVGLEKINIHSTKPLSTIFYYSQINPDRYKSFRERFVNALYEYAYGCSRVEYLKNYSNQGSYQAKEDDIDAVTGYWEFYYDKHNRFKERNENKNALLNKLCFVITKENNGAKVKFFHFKNHGTGKIEIHNNNLIFHLYSEMFDDPLFVVANIGKRPKWDTMEFDDFHDVKRPRIDLAIGIILYVDKFSCPKSGRCVMKHFNDDDLEKQFGVREKDIDMNNFLSHDAFIRNLRTQPHLSFEENNEIDFSQMRIKKFFENDSNTTIVQITDFLRLPLK